jgi:8-oxo-dGTP diphosphatase
LDEKKKKIHDVSGMEIMNINYNLIAVFDTSQKHVLMCKRRKDPYKGLYNLVGGKIEDQEDGLCAAYRELQEETSVSKNEIKLTHFIDFTYYVPSIKIEVYVGSLNKAVLVYGEENDLEWISINKNFFDTSQFAGEGNIGHIIKQVLLFKKIL